MRISDWSSDVCSSDLLPRRRPVDRRLEPAFDGLSLAVERFYIVLRELGPKQRERNGSLGIRAREEQVHNEIVDEEQLQKHKPDSAGRSGCIACSAVWGGGTPRSEGSGVGKECVGMCRYRWGATR